MNYNINPFQQLYFSDDPQSEKNFVQLFSDEVLQTAINPIFQGGNVVLLGTQGCGKTMILSLLRPETRIAYASAGVEFPVAENSRNFVSAGVNITRSGIFELVQTTLHRGEDADERELPLYFADLFNYWIVQDLLESIQTIGRHPHVFGGVVDLSNLPDFVTKLVSQDCWFGSLSGITQIESLNQRICERTAYYRAWMNGNLPIPEPARSIQHTKTNIGEPIARTALCLRETGVIKHDIPVLIRVDQIDELHRAFTERQRRILLAFRKMVNRAFAMRDARVNYRAGSRRYGWNDLEFLNVWGSEARLEQRRDYLLIDMDKELFAQGENKNTVFERFAVDAFHKRVQYYFDGEAKDVPSDFAHRVFGKHPVARTRLSSLNLEASDVQIDRALGLDLVADGGKWSPEWREFLRRLYRSSHEGMLDSVLAAAWGRQTGGKQYTKQHREDPPPHDRYPWRERKWWRKERLDQAVLQLTTRCQQRFMWWGYRDILSLSGSNITVFLHICHRVWDGFLKSQSSVPEAKRVDLFKGGTIDRNVQSAGIQFASNEWFKKFPEEPRGDARQRFIEELGMRLNADMLNDLAMRYPGGNGFSLKESEFERNDPAINDIRSFIREAVGYGALLETQHASKSKSGRRVKFYLNPILCPRFQLPEARTKEPYYWNQNQLFALIKKAKITVGRAKLPAVKKNVEPMLFPDLTDNEK